MKENSSASLAIAAIFKNEGPYILEWLAYHRAIGVEKFYIADNNSDDGSTELLAALQSAGLICHLPFPHIPGQPPQLAAYAEIMRTYGVDVDWMAFIDADEFLLPSADSAFSIKPIIDEFDADKSIGAIAVNWATYGSSKLIKREDGLVIERFTKRADREWPQNFHYKSIVRTKAFLRTHGNPHLFVLGDDYSFVHANGERVVDHAVRGPGLSHSHTWDRLRLNHYVVKSKEEFDHKKRLKGSAASVGRMKGDDYFAAHDRNEVVEPMPDQLIQATKAEVFQVQKVLVKKFGTQAQALWTRAAHIDTTKYVPPPPKPRPYKAYLDLIVVQNNLIKIRGWVITPEGNPASTITLRLGAHQIADAKVKRIERPDVVRHYPYAKPGCGFEAYVSILNLPRDVLTATEFSVFAGDATHPFKFQLPMREALKWPALEVQRIFAESKSAGVTVNSGRA